MPLYQTAFAGINWASDTIVVAAFEDDFVVDLSDRFLSDITGTELSGGNYSRKTLASKTVTATSDNIKVFYDAADISWTNLTASELSYLVVFKDTGVAGTSALIGYLDVRDNGSTRVVTADDVDIQWQNNGLFFVRYT